MAFIGNNPWLNYDGTDKNNEVGTRTPITDDLNSNSSTHALSAKAGNILKKDADIHKQFIANELSTGHVKVDDETIKIKDDGTIYVSELLKGEIDSELRESIDSKIKYIGLDTSDDLQSAINNTSSGGRLVLKNGAIYNLTSSVSINKDIIIDANNATIQGTGAIRVDNNFEISNAILKTNIDITSHVESVKIYKNKFKNIQGSAIECWKKNVSSLIVEDNESDDITFILNPTTGRGFNNNGSFVYLNMEQGHKIDYLKVKNNIIKNTNGGTVIYIGNGAFGDVEISNNRIDTMGQRAIGFWAVTEVKGVVSNNRIYRCGVLKTPGERAGVGCNAIYSTANTHDVDVLDNYIEYVYENGIEGSFKSIKRNTINGTGMDLVNYPTPSVEGIYFESNAVIEDNTIINAKQNGLYYYNPNKNPHDVIIRRNRIICDNYNDKVAICFRSPSNNTQLSNITIEDNIIDNYATVIELPNNKDYKNVNIGKQDISNYSVAFNGFNGFGLNLEKLVNGINVLKNSSFDEWDSDTDLSAWSKANSSVLKLSSANGVKKTVKVTASDAFNGRIRQFVNTELPNRHENTFLIVKLRAKISTGNSIMLRVYGLNGLESVDNSMAYSVTTSISTNEDFKTYHAKLPYYEGFRIEVCNDATAGSWYELSDIVAHIVDLPL